MVADGLAFVTMTRMNLEEAVNSYMMPEAAKRLVVAHPPLAIAGPTGAGKGTVTQYLTQSGAYGPSVSETTRQPRLSGNGYEVDGVHYHFIDEAEALQRLADGAYVEAKMVHGTTMYATSIEGYERVTKSGRTVVLEIDVQGVEEIMAQVPEFDSILLLPPSFEIWEQRIDGRGDMNLEDKLRRFRSALIEFQKPATNPRFFPVVNTEVIDTAKIITSGAYREEKYRQAAFQLAVELRDATQAFLSAHEP